MQDGHPDRPLDPEMGLPVAVDGHGANEGIRHSWVTNDVCLRDNALINHKTLLHCLAYG